MTSLLRRLRGSSALKGAARAGLVGRGAFYVLLAGLCVGVLVTPPDRRQQANANGALTAVATTTVGRLMLAAAVVGFVAFGLLRLAAALTDDRQGRLRRLSTAGQAAVYLVLGATTAAFLLGQRTTGSETQQRRTAAFVLGLPGGRLLVVGAGLAVLAVCCWQLQCAVRGHFADTLHTEQMSGEVRRLTRLTARIGIPARALSFVPVGVFLIVAGVRADPDQAKGLDAILSELVRTAAGRATVAVVAAGFAVFAAYSMLEARYRQVSAGA